MSISKDFVPHWKTKEASHHFIMLSFYWICVRLVTSVVSRTWEGSWVGPIQYKLTDLHPPVHGLYMTQDRVLLFLYFTRCNLTKIRSCLISSLKHSFLLYYTNSGTFFFVNKIYLLSSSTYLNPINISCSHFKKCTQSLQ